MEMDTRPIGWFKFNCPLLVFRCPAPKFSELPPESREEILEGHKAYLSLHSERDFIGHFGKECHEA
eukprot:4572709-Amphidinium_carterae.1